MTTTIRGALVPDSYSTTIDGSRADIRVTFKTPTVPSATTILDRDELLAAVAAELGVIIINRADLPEVVINGDEVKASSGPGYVATSVGWETAEKLRGVAYGWLAIAEYLDAHPPVDEAQVDALAELLVAHSAEMVSAAFTNDTSARDAARRLLATGRVTVREA
ncbi:hypothetical protein [Georgenia thermotolerans]|uniref:hypothetical protein n=1 Tax=Georgenia thermotolerans TaxID=527326 RepID=UPI001264C111|nr:hypothetical protein [Georgenia thermotolerans]